MFDGHPFAQSETFGLKSSNPRKWQFTTTTALNALVNPLIEEFLH
jgi:hypothetical protein